jgi:hypothetical protein
VTGGERELFSSGPKKKEEYGAPNDERRPISRRL